MQSKPGPNTQLSFLRTNPVRSFRRNTWVSNSQQRQILHPELPLHGRRKQLSERRQSLRHRQPHKNMLSGPAPDFDERPNNLCVLMERKDENHTRTSNSSIALSNFPLSLATIETCAPFFVRSTERASPRPLLPPVT